MTNEYGHEIIESDSYYMSKMTKETKCRIDVTVIGSNGRRRIAFRRHCAHSGSHEGREGFFTVLERGPGVFIPAKDAKIVE